MLKRFYVNNFKSLLNFEYEPGGVNLLVGKNNAGKTNLCQALCFLSLTASKPLAVASTAATSLVALPTNFYFNDTSVSFALTCELNISEDLYTFSYELVLQTTVDDSGMHRVRVDNEHLSVSGGAFSDTRLLENAGGEVQLLHEGRFVHNQPEPTVSTTAPTDATMLSRLYDLRTNELANAFRRYLVSWQYFDLEVRQIRAAPVTPEEFILRPDGSNLASLLRDLKLSRGRTYRDFVEVVKTLEEDLDDISFYRSPDEFVLMALELQDGGRLVLPNVSNGTLRFMALAFVVLSNLDRARVLKENVPLVIIEEPENGLYVRCLRSLIGLVEEAASEGLAQYIFTSHSPYFIDLFDKHIPDISVVEKPEKHSILRKPSAGKVQKLLEEIPLGEIHFRELWS